MMFKHIFIPNDADSSGIQNVILGGVQVAPMGGWLDAHIWF